MTAHEFIEKWRGHSLTERASAQSHFIDLCALVGHKTPTEADPDGDWFTFEKGLAKSTGGQGWADVWKRGHFAWEYKGPKKDLKQAYAQLQQYAVNLENPPLLVVCDTLSIRIHTNWTNSISRVIDIPLEELREPAQLKRLKAVFHNPEELRPGATRAELTQEAAKKFAKIADALRDAGHEPMRAAHFINRLVFCMFAEDTGILDKQLFSKMVDAAIDRPADWMELAGDLFANMSKGGRIGYDKVEWFNGGLFDDGEALPLTRDLLLLVREAARMDWSAIDPSILGTLFERGLDPAKRAQLGAHYTDPENIMRIFEPVVLRPLRREWEAARERIMALKAPKKRDEILQAYLARLRAVRVLDPACGSGNFLFIALRELKDLELAVLNEAEALELGRAYPEIGPEVVKGIEISPYAAELARVTVWIGEIQWQLEHGFDIHRNPILKPLDTIECRDALLNEDGTEAEWPVADFIIGNPPFLGTRKQRSHLGDAKSVAIAKAVFGEDLPGYNLVTYWFKKSYDMLLADNRVRAGLVATQSITRGKDLSVLGGIHDNLQIVAAWRNQKWIVDGAKVRVCIVCFSSTQNPEAQSLNGEPCEVIAPDLWPDQIDARRLVSLKHEGVTGYQGIIPRSLARISPLIATQLLNEPNVNRSPSSDVIRPFFNSRNLILRNSPNWVVDVSPDQESKLVEYSSLGHLVESVSRVKHIRYRGEMRRALSAGDFAIVTPRVSKHRFFYIIDMATLPDSRLYVFSPSNWITFGVLESRIHREWSLRLASIHGFAGDVTYNGETCFETFPFPRPTEAQAAEIAAAAEELNRMRENWLNPPEWTQEEALAFPATVGGPWHRWIPGADALEPGSVHEARYIRLAPRPGHEADLKKRTLTNLYNARPAWLARLHQRLDEAVAAAYAWPADLPEPELLRRLLELNLERAAEESA